MSRKSNFYDNTLAESFFKTLKIELVYQNRYKTKKTEKSISDCIENFYNTCRRHSTLENLTNEEFNKHRLLQNSFSYYLCIKSSYILDVLT